MNENKMKYVEELIHLLPNDKYWMRFLEFQILMNPLEPFQQHILPLIFCRSETIETENVGTQRIKIRSGHRAGDRDIFQMKCDLWQSSNI